MNSGSTAPAVSGTTCVTLNASQGVVLKTCSVSAPTDTITAGTTITNGSGGLNNVKGCTIILSAPGTIGVCTNAPTTAALTNNNTLCMTSTGSNIFVHNRACQATLQGSAKSTFCVISNKCIQIGTIAGTNVCLTSSAGSIADNVGNTITATNVFLGAHCGVTADTAASNLTATGTAVTLTNNLSSGTVTLANLTASSGAVGFTQNGGASVSVTKVCASTTASVNVNNNGGTTVPSGGVLHGGTSVSLIDPTGVVVLDGNVNGGTVTATGSTLTVCSLGSVTGTTCVNLTGGTAVTVVSGGSVSSPSGAVTVTACTGPLVNNGQITALTTGRLDAKTGNITGNGCLAASTVNLCAPVGCVGTSAVSPLHVNACTINSVDDNLFVTNQKTTFTFGTVTTCGSLNCTVAGNLTLGNVHAGGTIDLTSTGGSITELASDSVTAGNKSGSNGCITLCAHNGVSLGANSTLQSNNNTGNGNVLLTSNTANVATASGSQVSAGTGSSVNLNASTGICQGATVTGTNVTLQTTSNAINQVGTGVVKGSTVTLKALCGAIGSGTAVNVCSNNVTAQANAIGLADETKTPTTLNLVTKNGCVSVTGPSSFNVTDSAGTLTGDSTTAINLSLQSRCAGIAVGTTNLPGSTVTLIAGSSPCFIGGTESVTGGGGTLTSNALAIVASNQIIRRADGGECDRGYGSVRYLADQHGGRRHRHAERCEQQRRHCGNAERRRLPQHAEPVLTDQCQRHRQQRRQPHRHCGGAVGRAARHDGQHCRRQHRHLHAVRQCRRQPEREQHRRSADGGSGGEPGEYARHQHLRPDGYYADGRLDGER